MATAALHIFPLPILAESEVISPIRRSTSVERKLQKGDLQVENKKSNPPRASSKQTNNVGRLQGLALQVTPRSAKSLLVEPASDHVKHSLFCDPTVPVASKEKSILSPICDELAEEDSSSTLQLRREATSSPPPPGIPRHSSSLRGRGHRPRGSGDSSQCSIRSGTTLVRSNSTATDQSVPQSQPSHMQSIFPRYEYDLPLSQQPYYPPSTSTAIRLPIGQISKGIQSPRSFAIAPEQDPAVQPISGLSGLMTAWEFANAASPKTSADRLRLRMRRRLTYAGDPSTPGLTIDFVSNLNKALYTVKAPRIGWQSNSGGVGDILIERSHPADGTVIPVTQMECQSVTSDANPRDPMPALEHVKTITTIFPQIAALSALQAAANTRRACSIAHFDPRASSPQAIQLAFDAVAGAKENEECELDFVSLREDYPLDGKYTLHHPSLGALEITKTGRIDLVDDSKVSQRCSRSAMSAKITLHGPNHIAASSSEASLTLGPALIMLDLASEILEVDLASLKGLGKSYLLDSVVSAVVAVALTETARHVNDTTEATFAAPPTAPLTGKYDHRRTPSAKCVTLSPVPQRHNALKRIFRKIPKGKSRRAKTEKDADRPKLPAITRGILHVLGFSFDAVVWLLSIGVKILSKLVVGISRTMQKP